jgi:hypothetical protein
LRIAASSVLTGVKRVLESTRSRAHIMADDKAKDPFLAGDLFAGLIAERTAG